MTPNEQLSEQIAELDARLKALNPNMPLLLKEIHQKLKADPAITTLLSEEEIAIVVSGLKRQTNTEIATSISKGKGKALKAISVMDL